MRKRIVFAAFVIALCPVGVQAADPHRADVTVMTRNMYLGADIGDLLDPELVQTPEDLIAAATATVTAIEASNPPVRIAAIADEIARQQPDLVGLQEAIILRTAPFTVPPTPATTVEVDFVELLLQALAARGLPYTVVASVDNFDAQVPLLTAAGLQDVRLTDRDVILARAGVAVSNVQAENYAAGLEVPSPLGVITVPRGWVAVDVTIESGTFRFVNTHLETFSVQVQVAQAMELLAGPLSTSLPLVLVCDCNSDASGRGPDTTPTYELLVVAGLIDAWSVSHPGARGFTCCQDPDLGNTPSLLYERIDFVFVRGPIDVEQVRLVGAHPGDRTPKREHPMPERLWPSDHAGLVAELQLD